MRILIALLLLLLGACTSTPSDTRLHQAVVKNDLKAMQSLLASGLKVDAQAEYGIQAIHLAAHQGQVELLQALLAAGAQIEAEDDLGNRPLHYAVVSAQGLPTAQFLLQKGAQFDAKNDDGAMPMLLASFANNTPCALLFFSRTKPMNPSDLQKGLLMEARWKASTLPPKVLPTFSTEAPLRAGSTYTSPNGGFIYKSDMIYSPQDIQEQILQHGGNVQFVNFQKLRRVDYADFNPTVEKQVENIEFRKMILQGFFHKQFAPSLLRYLPGAKFKSSTFETVNGIPIYAVTLVAPKGSLPAANGSRHDAYRCMLVHTDGKMIWVFTSSGPIGDNPEVSEKSIKGDLAQFFGEVNLTSGVKTSQSAQKIQTLHEAARQGNVERLKELIESGVSPNIEGSGRQKGTQALLMAVSAKKIEAVKYLISAGANIDAVVSPDCYYNFPKGWRAIHAAITPRNIEILKTLVEAGADVNYIKGADLSPLAQAVCVGDMDIIKYLIENKADLHIKIKGSNLLHMASYCGHDHPKSGAI
ncbi:MAG: hypothetical protein RL095_2988 [Verrucomicrobiota bacterium]